MCEIMKFKTWKYKTENSKFGIWKYKIEILWNDRI